MTDGNGHRNLRRNDPPSQDAVRGYSTKSNASKQLRPSGLADPNGNGLGTSSASAEPATTGETTSPNSSIGLRRPELNRRLTASPSATHGEGAQESRPLRGQSAARKPTRRTRRTAKSTDASETQRALPKVRGADRVKSKSSVRTRALKARSAKKERAVKGGATKAGTKMTSIRSAAGKRSAGRTASRRAQSLAEATTAGKATQLATRRRRRSLKPPKPLRYLTQLVVAGCGIAIIGGTILSVLPNQNEPSAARTESVLATDSETAESTFPVPLTQEISSLKRQLEQLPDTYPKLTPKIFYVDVPDDVVAASEGNYVDVEGSDAVSAASTIKLPILLAFFQAVDENRISLDQTMAIAPEQIAEGSGEMQVSPPGTQFTALEVATQMIIDSDNTATNMMIDLLGGAQTLNNSFVEMGLENTQLSNPLPDVEGQNTTSARDLVHTMLLISEGDVLTMRSRDRVFNILGRTYNKGLIPSGLAEQGALTYNKTGNINPILADVALVDLNNGKRYVLAVIIERPDGDNRAADLIRRISQETFKRADNALKPAVTPLGDPNGTAPDTDAPSAAPNTGAATIAPVDAEPTESGSES